MPRTRDLGIHIGLLPPGPHDAITDVPGVRVGYCTRIEGTDVRTGVTVVDAIGENGPVFAGVHCLNGNGEMTGWHFIREMGILGGPVAITNTHSVGAVHAALIAHAVRRGSTSGGFVPWDLPVVAETYDGLLNDINGFHVGEEQVEHALADLRSGSIAEGNVGGGTGMTCHGFKGGTGTASRVVPDGYMVGVLVQANYGSRERLTVDGVPVGREIGADEVPLPGTAPPDTGSIIALVATDAPLLPHQCDRLAQRAGLGIARVGGVAADSSGDLFLALSTANRLSPDGPAVAQVEMLANARMTPLFTAAVDATEEAVLNALLAAETMTGRSGATAWKLPENRLVEVMRAYGRLKTRLGNGVSRTEWNRG